MVPFVMVPVCYSFCLLWPLFALVPVCFGICLLWPLFAMVPVCFGSFSMVAVSYVSYLL